MMSVLPQNELGRANCAITTYVQIRGKKALKNNGNWQVFMRVDKGVMVALGYGKFFRSDSIVGLEPIEENRGPGQRTNVHIAGLDSPLIASRSENAILRDLVGRSREESQSQEQYQLLSDIRDTLKDVNPLLRSIIRDQGKWDLDRLEERLRDVLGEEDDFERRENRLSGHV